MFTKKRKEKLTPIHAKLDYRLKRNENVFQTAIQSWFAFTIKQVQHDLRNKFQKDVTADLTDWDLIEDKGKTIIKPAAIKVINNGGDEAYKIMNIKGSFDVLNPDAVIAADKFTAELVTQVNKETKKGIRNHISVGIKEGKSMDKIARELRPLVGLTGNQTSAVNGYKKLLQDKDRFPNLSDIDIDKKVQRYAAKTHRRRTKMIARTETARAQNLGYVTGMESLGVTQLQFQVHPDEITCPICWGLDKDKYPLSEAGDAIPVHPNCRCAMLPVIGGKVITSKIDMIEAMPTHVSDLVSRWENAVSRSNKWVLKDKLRKLGYNTSGDAIGAPVPKTPTPKPEPKPKPKVPRPGMVAELTDEKIIPQEVKDLIIRWENASSRSNKWVIGNKLKKLGYDVKTGLYSGTGVETTVVTFESLGSFDIKNLNPLYKKKVIKELDTLAKDFPLAARNLDVSVSKSLRDFLKPLPKGEGANMIAYYNSNTHSIVLNPNYYKLKSIYNIDAVAGRLNKSGWLTGSRMEDIITHEFGHAIHRRKINFIQRDKLRKYYNQHRTGMEKVLSTYAKENEREMFAEAFTMVRKSKVVSKEAKEIMKIAGVKI